MRSIRCVVCIGWLWVLLTACRPDSALLDRELMSEIATRQVEQSTQLARQERMLSYLLTVVPREAPQDTPAATPAAQILSPVVGSVMIEEDSCCAGGIVGDTIELHVQFDAKSPSGDILQMRYTTGHFAASEEDLRETEWQEYRQETIEEYEITAANWIGYWVSVQYMDAEGDVSPVYVDDISIEGHLAPPTEYP